jgi:hypothetical protein
VPCAACNVCPSRAAPAIVGAAAVVGTSARTAAVEALVATALPPALPAMTFTRMAAPMSASVSV